MCSVSFDPSSCFSTLNCLVSTSPRTLWNPLTAPSGTLAALDPLFNRLSIAIGGGEGTLDRLPISRPREGRSSEVGDEVEGTKVRLVGSCALGGVTLLSGRRGGDDERITRP